MIAVGVVIVAAASISAIVWEYKHFYEFSLLGLVLLLAPSVPAGAFSGKRIARLYVLFFGAGLVVDLLLGITITQSWYYNYSSVFEYIVLYTWIYPLGGFVMAQSYLVARRVFKASSTHEKHIDLKVFWIAFSIPAAVTIGSLIFKDQLIFSQWSPIMAVSAALMLCAAAALRSELRGKRSYLRDLISAPWQTVLATLLATYINLPIHEYPNVYAREWVYVPATGTFLDSHIIGIAVLYWLMWPLLVVGSMSLYYRTEDAKK